MTRVSIGVADRLSKGGGRASSRDATSGLRRGYLRRSDTPLCFQMDLFPRPGRGNSCTPLAINLDRTLCLRPAPLSYGCIQYITSPAHSRPLHYHLSVPRLSLTADLTCIVSGSSSRKRILPLTTGDDQRVGSSALSPFLSSLALGSCDVSVVRRGHAE